MICRLEAFKFLMHQTRAYAIHINKKTMSSQHSNLHLLVQLTGIEPA